MWKFDSSELSGVSDSAEKMTGPIITYLFNINKIPARNREYLAVKATDLNNLTFCGFVHHQ